MPMPQEWKAALEAEAQEIAARQTSQTPAEQEPEQVQVRPDHRQAQRYASGSKVGRKQQYPWELWLDGDWHQAEHGLDFECKPASFRSYLYNYALNNGYTVETMVLTQKPVVAFEFKFTPVGE